jgi:cholesterol transport system auxiliary component
MIRLTRRLILGVLALTPTGCGGLLPTGGVPPKLYTLTPVVDFPPGGARVGWQLLVDVPVSAAALDSERIAITRSATSFDYFADAAWTDRAPLMVQSLFVQSFENSGRISAIARESLALRADYVLRPELRRFEADYSAGATPLGRVELALKLVKLPERAIVGQRRFEATAPAKENQVPAIVDALDAALHQAMRPAVEWVLDTGR